MVYNFLCKDEKTRRNIYLLLLKTSVWKEVRHFSVQCILTETTRPYGVYISQIIRFARVCSNIDDFNNRTLFLTAKLLKQGYRYSYHKIRKAFSKLYHRHSELIVKYNISLKTLLQQGISESIFYGDLVNKFKIIVGNPNFSDQFKRLLNVIKSLI